MEEFQDFASKNVFVRVCVCARGCVGACVREGVTDNLPVAKMINFLFSVI
jgi:hypothetical protein